jgi:pimeloyl-ACP methyl ester carboxylesterase
MRIDTTLVALLATTCLSCAGAPRPATVPQNASQPVLDEVVEVGGLQLYLRCEGSGSPLVIFEAGLGFGALHWRSVQPQVARHTRTCAYDRPGRGRSGPPPQPHPLPQMAEELRALLGITAQRGPYVLVGHSMGAGIARWFEVGHSDEVAGMVLVDPATADAISQAFATVPPEALAEYDRNIRSIEGIDRQTYLAGFSELQQSGHTLGERPLFVLLAREPAETFALREQQRREVMALSSDVVRVVAESSGHNIAEDQPALVTQAILAVVNSVRAKRALSETWLVEGKR